jgi:hypothetical protein
MNPGLLKPEGWARTTDLSTQGANQVSLQPDGFSVTSASNQKEVRPVALAHPMNETCKRVEASAEQGDLQWAFSLE